VSDDEFESPDRLLRRIYDEDFGFLPTNRSMKPVHVANATCRRLVGFTSDYIPLARVLRQYVKNQGAGYMEERNPNAAILTDFPGRFIDPYGNAPSDEHLTAFRSLAKETLGADGAAFETGQASFTLSHHLMVTGDLSDNGSGDFLAALMTAGDAHRPTPAASLIRELLKEDADPWTMIGWPMLGLGTQREALLTGTALARSERVAGLLGTDSSDLLVSPTLRELRSRYDQLADYENTYGAKLTALRRMILFGCFAIHVHMIRRCGDVIPDGPRPPILLDLFDGRRRSLREASAATLQAGFRAIEQLVLYRIRAHVHAVTDHEGTEQVGEYVDGLPASEVYDELRSEYATQLVGADPGDALAEAFWKMGYSGVGPESVKGFPWNALLALGRRSGYLLPYDDRGRGGKEHKRYGANAEFAEVLVAATVLPGNPIDFDVFLDHLRESFGIVLGRRTDFEIIRRNDLRFGAALQRSVSVNENDLRANLLAFRNLLIDIGLAKSYADGRTVVTTDEGRALCSRSLQPQRATAHVRTRRSWLTCSRRRSAMHKAVLGSSFAIFNLTLTRSSPGSRH
jgi:hypothetical protein